MDAVTIIEAVASLINALAPLAQQAVAAEQAGDQASLDALHAKVVAASNAVAPAGATPVAVS